LEKRIIILHKSSRALDMYSQFFQWGGLEVAETFHNIRDLTDYFVVANKSLDRRIQLESSVVLIASSLEGVDVMEAARDLKRINSTTRLILATAESEGNLESWKNVFDSIIAKPFLVSELVQEMDDLFTKPNVRKTAETDHPVPRSGVVLGLVDTTRFFLDTIKSTRRNFDAIVEASGAQFFEIEDYKSAIKGLNERGIPVRVIVEISVENYEMCKEIAKVMELRHMENIQGSFCLTDDTYLSSTEPLDRVELVPKLFYSTFESIVNQHHFLFETLWKDAIPAEQRFQEFDRETLDLREARSTHLNGNLSN
jgi:DNA-binding response OmpR family regulator